MSARDDSKALQVARRRRRTARLAPSVELQAVFGKPPLLPGESEVEYLDMAGRVRDAMEPRDALEQILIRDVIDASWEIIRLKGVKASYLRSEHQAAAINLIEKYDPKAASQLRRAPPGKARINAELRRLKLQALDVNAEAYIHRMDILDKVERQIALLTARRNSLLLEFEQRREAVDRWARRHGTKPAAAVRETLLEIEGEVIAVSLSSREGVEG